MSQVVRYDNLEYSTISYEKPENQGTVYFGPMSYDSHPFLLQSSRLQVKEIKDEGSHTYLVCETDMEDFTFYDKMVQLDDHNLDRTYQQSEAWFNKELPMDVLEEMYKRITQPIKKGETPQLRFKLSSEDQDVLTKCYNQANELVDLDSLVPGTSIIMMVHIRGLKFLKQHYYCDMSISQIKLVKDPVSIVPAECLIVDEGIVDNGTAEVPEGKYDYEIVDEEEIVKNKAVEELTQQIADYQQKIEKDTCELSRLETALVNLA